MALATTAAERFIALCNELDDARRHALIDETFTEDALYFDTAHGAPALEGIESARSTVLSHLASARVSLAGEPEVHHDWMRMRWKVTSEDQPDQVLEGTYYCQLAGDGRFSRIVGFLDRVPAPAAP
jgi:hypothetical protein